MTVFVETSDNPFDSGKSLIGLDNNPRKTPRQKELQRKKERIDKEKDSDIKQELKKGNNVEIID